MLRSLRQAMYSPDNVGHFGLAYESYTHFTSPIRRYPDLLIHRGIKAALAGEQYRPGDWEQIGLHCSMTERRADDATRDVVAFLKCFFMQDRVGEEFVGSVSAVVPFGLFVALDDIFIEGLLHISDLGSDYFHYDETRHALMGERTAKQFRLSDRVKVQLVRVDMATNKIDFRLIEGPLPVASRGLPQPVESAPVAAKPEAGKKAVRKPRSKKVATEPMIEAAPAPTVALPVAAPAPAEPKSRSKRAKKVAAEQVAEAAPAPVMEPLAAVPEPVASRTRNKRAKKAAAEPVGEVAPAPVVESPAIVPEPAAPKPRATRAKKSAVTQAVEASAAVPEQAEPKPRKGRAKKLAAEPVAALVVAPPAASPEPIEPKPRKTRAKKVVAKPVAAAAAEALESAPSTPTPSPTAAPARRAARKTSAKGPDRG
jgi:ribonuclease R